MFRKQILENAIRTVCQDRRDEYGQIEDNFGLIADLWSSYLGASVTAVDVAMMMGMIKMARIKTGKYTQDNFVDLAGYAACGAECTPEALQEKERRVADVPEPIVEPMRSLKKKKSGRKKTVDTAKIRALHNAGWSAAKIADELGCSNAAVYENLRQMRAENEESEETEKEESET